MFYEKAKEKEVVRGNPGGTCISTLLFIDKTAPSHCEKLSFETSFLTGSLWLHRNSMKV